MSNSKEEIIKDIINTTHLAIENMDFSNNTDVKIISNLLDCCETAINLPNKRQKRDWIKSWREERPYMGSFSFLTKELSNDVSSFFGYIRMNEATFNYILAAIKNDIIKQNTLLRQSISPEEKLAATLRFLATGESYASTNFQTRLSASFLCYAVPEVCRAIWSKFKGEYLKFPTTKNDWELISEQFALKWQFPHCLGALDGKHISFQAKRTDGSFYFNYKGTNSIVLLALVDADCRFTYINVGCNGRCHDAGVLFQSDFKDVLNNAEKHFPDDKILGNGRYLPYVIVADDAFPLQKHILKPYSYKTKILTQQIFNIRLSRARHVVEHAFGILSNRFRIFQQRINLSVENVELITKTCCVLHNLLSKNTSTYLQLTSSESYERSETSPSESTTNPRGAAERIRQGFEEYFCNEGKVDWQESKL